MGRLLSGEADGNGNDENREKGIGDTLVDYCMLLSIDEAQTDVFSRCDSITKTCHAIVSHLFPKKKIIGVAWKNIPVEKQNPIFGK